MTCLAPSPHALIRPAHLARPHMARSLPAIRVDRGYPLEGTSSVGGYQPKLAVMARFDPPPRKGTAPCLDSAGFSPSLSSSPPWHYRPPQSRLLAPTETVISASSPLSGTRSRRSLGTAIAASIRTAGVCRAKLLPEPHLGGSVPLLPLLLSRGAPLRAPLFFRQWAKWRFNDYGRSRWHT